jgi:hypothetical protein
MPSVEPADVAELDPAHGPRQPADRAAHQEVEVRREDRESGQLEFASSDGARDSREEVPDLERILEYGPSRDPTIHDVMPCAREVGAVDVRHVARSPSSRVEAKDESSESR